jgi:cell division protein FtsI/penicillin-binding protein 2
MLINSLDAPGKEAAVALRHTLGTDRMLAAFKAYGLPSALPPATSDADWGAALSIGEIGFQTTALQIVSFLQAVGNGGIRIDLPPRAGTIRIMQEDTARELRTALLDTVERGTGRGIRGHVKSGWRIGGKTGTGPAAHQPYDGWFAGLAFDDKGVPRYAFATLILGGGKGGGIAAEVSADVINFLVTGPPSGW